jgi:hypothetical protein
VTQIPTNRDIEICRPFRINRRTSAYSENLQSFFQFFWQGIEKDRDALVQREREVRRFSTFRRFASGTFKAWGSIVR